MTCTYCETENPDDAQLCRECARPLPREVALGVAPGDPGASGAKTCPACQQTAPAEAQFCPNCGMNFTGADYGGFWRRFGGFVVDVIIVGVAGGIISAFLSAQAGSAVSLLIGIAYYIPLDANGGTWGKRAFGMRLEDAKTGEDIGMGRSALRYIVRFVSGVALLLGYFWCIWDPKKQTWHDKAAGSVVVRT